MYLKALCTSDKIEALVIDPSVARGRSAAEDGQCKM